MVLIAGRDTIGWSSGREKRSNGVKTGGGRPVPEDGCWITAESMVCAALVPPGGMSASRESSRSIRSLLGLVTSGPGAAGCRHFPCGDSDSQTPSLKWCLHTFHSGIYRDEKEQEHVMAYLDELAGLFTLTLTLCDWWRELLCGIVVLQLWVSHNNAACRLCQVSFLVLP